MNNYCDTHGLDLPCERCAEDRERELEYLRRIEKDRAQMVDESAVYGNDCPNGRCDF